MKRFWIVTTALSLLAGGGAWFAASAQTSPEKALIDDLVVANRILASPELGVLETAGHVSVRSATNSNHYYLSRWVAPGMVTADGVIEYDLDSKPVAGERKDQYLERYIHGEIYRARPDVGAVVHAHTPELIAFGGSSVPLASYDRNRGSFVKLGLPLFDIRQFNGGYTGIIETAALGKALAQVLANQQAVLLQGHGVVVVASSVYDLVSRASGLRRSAQMQERTILLGPKLTYADPVPAPARAASAARRVVPNGTGGGAGGDRGWEYWKQVVTKQLAEEVKGPKPPSGGVAKTRQELLVDLARANRLLASPEFGVLDTAGHVSVRDPENPNHYFLSRYVAGAAVRPDGIIEYDLDSVPVGSPRTDNYQERFIHGEVYKARPDVMAVVHSHTPELVMFGESTIPLRPMTNGGTFIGDGLPLFDIRKYRTANENIITTPALGRELAKVLGNSSAVLLLGHGAVTVAPSLYSLVGRVESLKTDADIQAQAIALGGEVKYWTQTATKPQHRENRATGEGGGRGWEYWVRHVSLE